MIHHSNFLFAEGQILPPIQVFSNSLNDASSYWFEWYHLENNILFRVAKELDPGSNLS